MQVQITLPWRVCSLPCHDTVVLRLEGGRAEPDAVTESAAGRTKASRLCRRHRPIDTDMKRGLEIEGGAEAAEPASSMF